MCPGLLFQVGSKSFRSLVSASSSRHQVLLGLPLSWFPCGFWFKAPQVMVLAGSLRVSPMHIHLLSHISMSPGSWLVRCQNSVLFMVLGYQIRGILLRQLFTEVNTFLVVGFGVLHVPTPYNRTGLMLGLNSRIIVCADNIFALQMFFRCKNAILALPILVLHIRLCHFAWPWCWPSI